MHHCLKHTLISQERETVVEVPKLRKDKCFRKEMIYIKSLLSIYVKLTEAVAPLSGPISM